MRGYGKTTKSLWEAVQEACLVMVGDSLGPASLLGSPEMLLGAGGTMVCTGNAGHGRMQFIYFGKWRALMQLCKHVEKISDMVVHCLQNLS